MTFRFIVLGFTLALITLAQSTLSHAQELTRQVSGQAFVDHDFITVQTQGADIVFKSSNPYDFRTNPDAATPFTPALFNYALTTSVDTLDACALHVIAWGQPVGVGLSSRGFLGRISADKIALTGDGRFKAARSGVTVNYSVDTGRPPNQSVWSEIISTARNAQTPKVYTAAEAEDIWGPKSYTPFITGIADQPSPQWIGRSGPPDNFYTVYSLPCAALIDIPASPKMPWLILAATALALLAVAAVIFMRRIGSAGAANSQQLSPQSSRLVRPSKPLERPENGGVIFPTSPMLAGNVAAPLSPAGHLTASNLQMLSGPYQILRLAYNAVGRIGYAQEGMPTSEDYSFGTGFLITPNHVMTNRHVHGFYGHYLTSDEDCGGIEFIAEKDKDASDFIAFDGKPPLLLEGLDIAIYTLSRAAKGRMPIERLTIPTANLDGRNIVVIGYPDTHEPNNPDILAAFEENPIFAVKRISQGQIFRHSTDTQNPFGVNVQVDKDDGEQFSMPAICHNASTLSGNSGSPILDVNTGALLGVHFAGYKIFNKKEAANLAMAIEQLTKKALKMD